MDLFLATTTFRRNLLHLVAPGGGQRMSARSTKEREGDDLIRKVGVETFKWPKIIFFNFNLKQVQYLYFPCYKLYFF